MVVNIQKSIEAEMMMATAEAWISKNKEFLISI